MAAELLGVALEMRILAAENDMTGDKQVDLGNETKRRWWKKGAKDWSAESGEISIRVTIPAIKAYVSQLSFIGVMLAFWPVI